MAKKRILTIEDDEDILELIRYNLSREGYEVAVATSGEHGLNLAIATRPDLVLLDLMLPGLDGMEICRRLKTEVKTREIPIVMLTAKAEEADIVSGLELGADDYITKPFSPRVLLARVRAVLRRRSEAPAPEDSVIQVNDIVIHPGRREVLVKDSPVKLTSTEFNFLHFLARRPGWVFTRYQIVNAIHGDEYPVTDRSVDTMVVGLRKKLGESGNCIDTVRGVGYRFKE